MVALGTLVAAGGSALGWRGPIHLGTTSCTAGMVGANVAFRVSGVQGSCSAVLTSLERSGSAYGQTWYLMPSLPGEPTVCRMSRRGTRWVVQDTGGQFYGQNLCQYLERAA